MLNKKSFFTTLAYLLCGIALSLITGLCSANNLMLTQQPYSVEIICLSTILLSVFICFFRLKSIKTDNLSLGDAWINIIAGVILYFSNKLIIFAFHINPHTYTYQLANFFFLIFALGFISLFFQCLSCRAYKFDHPKRHFDEPVHPASDGKIHLMTLNYQKKEIKFYQDTMFRHSTGKIYKGISIICLVILLVIPLLYFI